VASPIPDTAARLHRRRGPTRHGLVRSGRGLDSDVIRWKLGNDKDDTFLKATHELRATDDSSRQTAPVPGAAVSHLGLALRTTAKEGERR